MNLETVTTIGILLMEHFKCMGIDISKLLEAFKIYQSDTMDGISFMAIESDESDHCVDDPIFTIR